MTTRIRPRWRHAVAGLLAVTLAGAGAAGTSQAADPLVLDHGHVDAFNVSVAEGELVLNLAEDVTGSHVTHPPEDVLLHVKEDAWIGDIPDAYPGAPSGYVLPLTQDPDLLWPGWNTNGVAGSGYTDVTVDIFSVNGPGEVYLYTLSGFGEVTSLLTGGGYQLPGTLREETPAHTHAQWTFTEPGAYSLTVRAEATNPATGAAVTSDTATYAFSVGDEGQTPAPTALTIEGLAGRYHTGDPVELTAVPNAATDLDHYHWYTRDSQDDPWAAAEGGEGDRYTGTAEIDGQQVRAELLGEDHEVVAASDPVTVRIDDHGGGEPIETTLTVEGVADHYQPGDTAELTAMQDPATGLDHYHWFTRATADGGWELAGDAGSGDTYAFEVAEEADGRQVQARLYGDDHDVVATSEAVTIHVETREEPGSGEDPPRDRPGDTAGSGGSAGGAGAGVSGGSAGAGGAGDSGGVGGVEGSADGAERCYPVEEPSETAAIGAPGDSDVSDGSGDALVLDHGHIDAFSVRADGGDLVLELAEDVTGSHVTHAPEDVVLHVRPEALTEDIPSGYPGSPTGYLLPLTQDPDLLWPGWDTNAVAGSGYTDVSIDISSVNGPGEVYLYTTTTFGGAAPLLEGGGYELPGTLREDTPAHTHAQWTFAEAGTYTLTARAVATNPSTGASLTSNSGEYTFVVGPLSSATKLSAGAENEPAAVTVGRTADGEDCELPVALSGEGDLASTGSGLAVPALWSGAALLLVGTLAFVARRRLTDRAQHG